MNRAQDLSIATEWWDSMAAELASLPDPSEVAGLWFGLFLEADGDPDDGGQTRHMMYVAGTPTFTPALGDDWADDHCWLADDRYLRLPGLGSIPESQWERALEYTVGLLQSIAPWTDERLASCQGIGVGFDDGDITILWERPSPSDTE